MHREAAASAFEVEAVLDIARSCGFDTPLIAPLAYLPVALPQ
jgi:hypothetical protein